VTHPGEPHVGLSTGTLVVQRGVVERDVRRPLQETLQLPDAAGRKGASVVEAKAEESRATSRNYRWCCRRCLDERAHLVPACKKVGEVDGREVGGRVVVGGRRNQESVGDRVRVLDVVGVVQRKTGHGGQESGVVAVTHGGRRAAEVLGVSCRWDRDRRRGDREGRLRTRSGANRERWEVVEHRAEGLVAAAVLSRGRVAGRRRDRSGGDNQVCLSRVLLGGQFAELQAVCFVYLSVDMLCLGVVE